MDKYSSDNALLIDLRMRSLLGHSRVLFPPLRLIDRVI